MVIQYEKTKTAKSNGYASAKSGEEQKKLDPFTLPIHPAADVFPLLEGEDLKELADSIAENGLREPIVIAKVDGMETVIDGRNRLAACRLAGVQPITQRFYGDDVVAFIIDKNSHRRHLTSAQKRELVATLLGIDPGKSDRQIAETAKVSPTTVGTVRRDLEATVQIGQSEKRVGKDGKERVQPAKPSADAQAQQVDLEDYEGVKQAIADEPAPEAPEGQGWAYPAFTKDDEEEYRELTSELVTVLYEIEARSYFKMAPAVLWSFKGPKRELYDRVLSVRSYLDSLAVAYHEGREDRARLDIVKAKIEILRRLGSPPEETAKLAMWAIRSLADVTVKKLGLNAEEIAAFTALKIEGWKPTYSRDVP